VNKREFAYALIPGLEQDIDGASKALSNAGSLLGLPESYLLSLQAEFAAAGLEERFQEWNEGTIFPEAMRRELFLRTI